MKNKGRLEIDAYTSRRDKIVEARAARSVEHERYMADKISHHDYYLWLAGFIRARPDLVPFSPEKLRASTNEHLNDLPLIKWDSGDQAIRPLAELLGLAWSLSESVCVLKAIGREIKEGRTPVQIVARMEELEAARLRR